MEILQQTINCGVNYSASSCPGYIYTLNGARSTISNDDYYTGNNTIDYTNYNSMYCGYNKAKGSYYWWLASPSAGDSDYVCDVGGYGACLNYYDGSDDGPYGVCPLVSLPSNIQLNIK